MQFSAVLLTLGTLVSTVDVILAVATVKCVCASTWLLCMTQPLVTFSLLPDEKQPLFTNFVWDHAITYSSTTHIQWLLHLACVILFEMEPLLTGICVT